MFLKSDRRAAAHHSHVRAREEWSSVPPKFENTNPLETVFLPLVSAGCDSSPPRFARPHRSIASRLPFRIGALPARAGVLPGSPAATRQFHPEKEFHDAQNPSSRPCAHPL